MNHFNIPVAVLTDSYKAAHFSMYPKADKMVAYGEFRRAYDKDESDGRFVFYGIRYCVESYLNKKWTVEDVENAEKFFATHNSGYTAFPWPKDLFLKFIKENDGYFPIKVEALPEGTVAHCHVPVYQITAEKEYSLLITFFETLLTHLWYPCSVATLSRKIKNSIQQAFDKSVDPANHFLIDYKLHDFGFRGVTTLEQAIIGGSAHLLNFLGSDTMAAGYYVQFTLNNSKPICTSIPATEHSVMTSWRSESDAIDNMVKIYGHTVFSCVLDSYDYSHCLNTIVPPFAKEVQKKGGTFVMRPDSGDPLDSVLMGLEAGEKAFGVTTNSKGYKVLKNASVIQGDGIDYRDVNRILSAVLAKGYSAESVTFGMGGGLLQKVNRDTMSFATKLSYIEFSETGEKRDIMKFPKTDNEKSSFPGVLKVVRNKEGIPMIYPAESTVEGENMLRVVYDKRPVGGEIWKDSFDEIRKRVEKEWNNLPAKYDPVSEELKGKVKSWIERQKGKVEAMKEENSKI
eukprot:TRINITY_DN2775_c0_g1_i1.p1 TRINITY_DN2775_c0_g1~~TRINITY_DN2775_c0_g1_i1.p1  ORF type:complete len:530 (-),score=120.59 TRINITY_DN2775_c0_g1_i1:68-1606(-)